MQTSKHLHKNFLLVSDDFEEESHRPRLNSALSDLGQFNNILRELKYPPPSISADYGDFGGGQLTEAYEYIAEQLEVRWKNGPTLKLDYIKELANKVLNQLKLVSITLGTENNPNEIFENLNFSGQKLQNSDRVRNLAFSQFNDPEAMAQIYNSGWQPFEKKFDAEERSDTFPGYIFPFSLVHNPGTNQARCVEDLREHWESQVTSTDPPTKFASTVIKDLSKCAPTYLALRTGKEGNFPVSYWTNTREV